MTMSDGLCDLLWNSLDNECSNDSETSPSSGEEVEQPSTRVDEDNNTMLNSEWGKQDDGYY